MTPAGMTPSFLPTEHNIDQISSHWRTFWEMNASDEKAPNLSLNTCATLFLTEEANFFEVTEKADLLLLLPAVMEGICRTQTHTRAAVSAAFAFPVGKAPHRARRTLIAGSATWVIVVVMYVVLFRPYDRYFSEDDALHLLSIIVLPPLACFVVYKLYRWAAR